MYFVQKKLDMVDKDDALQGRSDPMPVVPTHLVKDTPMVGPWKGMEVAQFGMGCFWGAERLFWEMEGVHSTQVGYGGGFTPHPTYEEVCSGMTGHTELVQVVFDPQKVSYEALLKAFFEEHDPTQGMRQGNDQGTQYRSAIYTTTPAQKKQAASALKAYDAALKKAGHDPITTEIKEAGPFYYAEDEHQQYLAKNPNGYCGLEGTGVSCPVGLSAAKKR